MAQGNPFRAGRPVTGEHFTNRTSELAMIEAIMLAEQNAVVISPRRYGKTSLLRVAGASVEAAGGLHAHVNLMRADSPAMIADSIAQAIVPISRPWLAGRLDEWRAAVARRLPHLRVTLGHDGWTATFEATGGDTDWSTTVQELMRLLGSLVAGGATASLVLDEFQVIAEVAPALAGVFKAAIDEVTGLSLVMSGSRRHLMEDLFVRDGAPLLGTATIISLELIPEAEMVDFVAQRMAASGKLCSEKVATHLFHRAHRLPNAVQLLGFFTWQEAGRRVTEHDVNRALDRGVDMAAPELDGIFDRLTFVQRRLLAEMARQGFIGQLFAGDFMRTLGVNQQSTLQSAVKRLQRDELIWQTSSGWQIVDALLESWIQRGEPV
jgi:hypothetical protein